jgi:DNA-binding Xre family transcriptional regulator
MYSFKSTLNNNLSTTFRVLMPIERDISKEFLKEVGACVSKKRKAKKLSLEKLGLEVGLTRMQMHRIESGYNITLKTLLKLAIALETKPGSLIKSKSRFKKEDLEGLINSSKSSRQKKKS